jgi:uncharacterized protein YjbI with pentapeptide repeats
MNKASKEKLVNCLKSNVKLWNRYRKFFDFESVDLRNSNLSYADLRYCNLRNSDLSNSYLRNSDLSSSDLKSADLRYCNLSNSYLINSNLSYADLSNTDLSNTDLSYADLRNSDLKSADLRNSNLSNASYANTVLNSVCPESGSYVAWKKASNQIVKLQVLASAKRSSSTSRKCRASKARVLGIYDFNKKKTKLKKISSDYDANFVYEIGKIVSVNNFDENRWNECATGIHHFITFREAVEY